MKILSSTSLFAAVALLCVSCAKESVAPTSITFVDGDQYEVFVGRTFQIEVALEPANADPSKIEWSTDDSSIASVTRGFVTGEGPGEATIFARCGDVEATASVMVGYLNVFDFSIPSSVEVAPGTVVEIPVSGFKPDIANAHDLTWTLGGSDKSYFSIEEIQDAKVLVRCSQATQKGYTCTLTATNFSKSKSLTTQVKAVFKRDIAPNARVGIYRKVTPVIAEFLYKVEGENLDGKTVPVAAGGVSGYFFIGTDDGYAITTEDILNQKWTVQCSFDGDWENPDKNWYAFPYSAVASGRLGIGKSQKVTFNLSNGSSASVTFKSQLTSISMERAWDSKGKSFHGFSDKNFVTTCQVDGKSNVSFTVKRPINSGAVSGYQFCLNAGKEPDPGDTEIIGAIASCGSVDVYNVGYSVPSELSSGSYARILVTKDTAAGTYYITKTGNTQLGTFPSIYLTVE